MDEEGNDQNEGIYEEEGRKELIDEEDEITDVDEGFMKGYEEEEKLAECSNCGKVLNKKTVEEEFNGKVYRFCSSDCAEEYEQTLKEE